MPNDYLVYLKSLYWQYQRSRALCRAGLKCEQCGHTPEDKELQVHHKTYERLGEEELDDLIVLCEACHRKEHGLPERWHPTSNDLSWMVPGIKVRRPIEL